MIDNKPVMQQALDALGLYLTAGHGNSTDFTKQGVAYDKAIECIAALGAAIAQPAQATAAACASKDAEIAALKGIIKELAALDFGADIKTDADERRMNNIVMRARAAITQNVKS